MSMHPIQGTVTDPAMDEFIRGPIDVSADDYDSFTLPLRVYQERAATTAIYPRVYTEDQVKKICTTVIWWLRIQNRIPDDPDIEIENLEDEIEQGLDATETDFNRLVYPILGLVGEAGELANKLKKVARDGQGMQTDEQTEAIVDELGDVLWYVGAVATETESNLGQIALSNLKKLFSRKERGVLGGSGDTR